MRIALLLLLACTALPSQAQRARDLGLPMEGVAGPLNAITDVAGIEVGFTTLIEGEGLVEVGKGPVRTGVTAIFPRGKAGVTDPVFGAWFSLNGNGEMTGTTWIEESGFVEGPVLITNTHSVGVARDAVIAWMVREGHLDGDFMMPVVAETYDALNDINGQHVTTQHALDAMDAAAAGSVAEGNVGGGTGMICHQFKGGTGTASQVVSIGFDRYTVGVLVQCNYGGRSQLRIAGVPVGREMQDPRICWDHTELPRAGSRAPLCSETGYAPDEDRGSIIIVLATDAPFLPHQLKRLVTRASLGVGKMGGIGGNSSGDIFLAFSTANPEAGFGRASRDLSMLPNEFMNPFFQAAIWAVEEAIINAMLAAESMTGADYLHVPALPHDRLIEVMKQYGRCPDC
ncbi:MAG: P1 family peptidase [Rhodothermales bacterium]|nr:P1 family peptidase [Rhodothermales bacterium]MBO6780361.1 P1 family peptidase [Rhodothermales bacterium]